MEQNKENHSLENQNLKLLTESLQNRINDLQLELDQVKSLLNNVEIERNAVIETHKQTMVAMVQACAYPPYPKLQLPEDAS